MHRFLRRISAVAATSVVLSTLVVTAASASGAVNGSTNQVATTSVKASTYSVTIKTSDKLGQYYGYTLVFYKAAGGYAKATISGNVTGAVSGDVAVLLAEPFGATSFAPTGQQVTLGTTGTTPYSFTDKPALATKYEVQVSTGSQVDSTSPAATVYVSAGGYSNHARTHCSGGRCTTSWRGYTEVPSSAYKTESGKRWYLYFALGRHAPKYVYLYKDATVSRARKISAGKFEQTFTFHYRTDIKNPSRDVYPEGCVKDTEKIDGIGLPRRTGCGSKKILLYVYVG
jgi:hypothetical protein